MQLETYRAPRLAGPLRTGAGVLFLAALAVAPLYYGATRLPGVRLVLALLATGGVLWAFSRAIARAYVPPPAAVRWGIALIAVSAIAWLFFLVPPELPAFTRDHLARIATRWPGSVVPRTFALTLVSAAVGIVALLALHDLARDARWRKAIAATMIFTGAAVALLGLLQNATRARGMYWDASDRTPGAFFGPFFHHTSAGAYLNTVWPLGLALALTLIRPSSAGAPRGIFVYALLLCTIAALAAHTAHVSKLPQVIAVFAFVAFAWWAGLWRALGEVRGLRVATVTFAAIAALTVTLIGATRLETIAGRWEDFRQTKFGERKLTPAVAVPPLETWPRLVRDDLFIPSDHRAYPLGDRGAAYATAFAAVEHRPWFGWGPGGWTAAAAAHSGDPFIRTFYLLVQFTHQDYLQTCVEWGLVGAAGWALLVPGALVHGALRLGPRPSHDFLGAGAIVSLGAVLTQSLIDFPLQIPAIQLNAVALAALAWSVPPRTPFSSSPHPFNRS